MDVDQIWQEMRIHIEWAEGFCLCVVFTDQTRELRQLRQRLEDAWQWRTAAITVIRPLEAESAVEHVFSALEQHRARLPGIPVPAWLDLCASPDAEQGQTPWEQARRECAARLNEARAWLMHDVARPLVLCLPLPWSNRLAVEAPDLWHVRAYSARLLADPVRVASSTKPPISLWLDDEQFPRSSESGALAAIEQELHRLREKLLSLGDRPAALRELAMWLLKRGDALREAGDGAEALGSYREAIALLRQLRTAIGDGPQVLRDLSTALGKLAQSLVEVGQVALALAATQERVVLLRQLRDFSGDGSQVLRDLAIALARHGSAQCEAGRCDQALDVYRESVALHRQLRASLGDSPQVLLDLSGSLLLLGDGQTRMGQLEHALDAYRESLELRRQVRDMRGDDPQSLEALASLLALLSSAETDETQRVAWHEEAMALRERLAEGSSDQAVRARHHRLSDVTRQILDPHALLGDNSASK